MNPFHGDSNGMLSDLANFYRARFSVLRASSVAELKTKIPGEYEWLKASAPQGFNSGFVIGRAYMTCHDPCRTSPSVYRMISVRGRGIGDEPGDIDTPFSQIEKVLTSQGWTKCRSADDSGKPTIDYFIKRDKMIRIFRYYSMGAGNSIEFGITTSGPLPRRTANSKQNPITSVPNDWATYSSPDVGLRFRYPPKWRLADNSILGPGAKYLAFGSNDFTGSFKITLGTEHSITHQPLRIDSGRPAPTCAPSVYKISGFAARTCFFDGENVADGLCTRDIEFLDVETGRYHLGFEPGLQRDYFDRFGQDRLPDIMEQVLSTIEIE
jgi:hypothetical protein